MNDPAPIGDRVVQELNEDNAELRTKVRRLETEGPSWTLQITGPKGFPVYSTGRQTQRKVLALSHTIGTNGAHERRELPDDVAVDMNEEAVSCRLDSFLQCQFILTSNLGQIIDEKIDKDHYTETLSTSVHDGRLFIEYGFCLESQRTFSQVHFNLPIPPNPPDRDIIQKLRNANELFDDSVQDYLSILANIVHLDAPIRFTQVNVQIRSFIGLGLFRQAN